MKNGNAKLNFNCILVLRSFVFYWWKKACKIVKKIKIEWKVESIIEIGNYFYLMIKFVWLKIIK